MNGTFSSLSALRSAVRGTARRYGLPPDVRSRLVLSVTEVAAAELAAGRSVTFTTDVETDRDHGTPIMAATLTAPQAVAPPPTMDLPLPPAPPPGPMAGETLSPTLAVTWNIALPQDSASQPRGRSRRQLALMDEEAALDEELRTALATVDSLTTEHRLLKHELAETNGGVLALYVQLEERDEQLRKAHGSMLQELEDALRPAPLTVDGLELAVHYEPADPHAPTGGDLYDWFTLPDGTLHITIVDALGHGVRSTRSALDVTHAVRTLALEGHPLQSILTRAHELLTPLAPGLMATALLARIDPVTGDLQLANGSHPPALLLREDGSARYLEVPGRGVGFPLPGSERLLQTRLAPGDLLILYTDGLTESRRNPIEGELRLIEAARHHADKPLRDIPGAIATDMHTLVLHPDDTLALAIRVAQPPPA
ncbi:serine/threonine-protein phosphatase [Streptomyces sp. ASQP_92]|uniref:PP2C family protein-serine/threonine phosphatase n=1 Tax=Streptomyces sp. ASQP_92 TaxID=2979116 RepID=UPI0021BEE7B4|nr:PP2C family protein-serine/threonine phosphatase [Streptomyces sp. ASQP_92]MCT9089981.1 serine/threonine-protein phosphatase [Streptomyces sp. ASQP_92]